MSENSKKDAKRSALSDDESKIPLWGGETGGEAAFRSFILDIINVFPFYIIIIDEDHNILLANDAILSALDMSQDQIIGGFCPKIIHGSKGPFSGCPLEDALTNNGYIEKDLLDPFYNNWVSSSIYPMKYRTKTGKKVFFHVAQDITKRKNAELNLEKQKAFLEHVLESLTQPFYVIDANDYTIKIANSAAKFGKLRENTRCYCKTHKRSTPCGGDMHPCPVKVILETKRAVVVEHVHCAADGSERYYEVHGYPIFDENHEVVQIIEYTFDITDRKEAEKSLMKTRLDLEKKTEKLEEHNITLKVLLGHQENEKKNIYQDMSESMNTLVFPYIEKLQSSGLSESQRELLAELRSNIDRVITPFSSSIGDDSLNLTPAETRIAMMIRDGKTAKEIASVQLISENTVKAHFRNIRSKLKIKNKKINLRSHLQTMLSDQSG